MLNAFRDIHLTWDKSTKRFHEMIRVASSDESGRKLVVQVVDGGQVQNLTGVMLNLYWKHAGNGTKGLDHFELVDVEKGIFQLYFTTGMLSNTGKLDAHLHLIDLTGAVTSEPFVVQVFPGIDTGAIQSSDSFSTLTNALNRVVTIELREDEREQNEVLRQSAEQARELSEDTRVQNENQRSTSEATRILDEVDRQAEELVRESNETSRDLAETGRNADEQVRQTNEDERVLAESDRKTRFDTLEGNMQGLEGEYAPRLTEVERKTNDTVYTVNPTGNVDFKNGLTKSGHQVLFFTESETW